MQTILRVGFLAAMLASLAAVARADQSHAKPDNAKADDEDAAPKPKYDVVAGPTTVDLGNDLSIALREGDLFLDKANARKFMTAAGNQPGDNLMGLVTQREASWIVEISFDPEGYVKDDEAGKLDADEILNVIREGTEEANKYREQHGFTAVRVDGWSEPPHYDQKTHHVIWGIKGSSARRGADGRDEVINFNTRVLGRKGYASLNLIDDAATLETSKPQATALLSATTFKPGARYEDFDAKSGDKVAEYGLAALVAGGAGFAALKLVKIGLLAKFGGKLLALIIAGKKAIVLLLVAAGAFIKKLLGIRKKDEPTAPPAPPPAAPGV